MSFQLDFCEECFQMTNHLDGVCQKCKSDVFVIKNYRMDIPEIKTIKTNHRRKSSREI